ncbi:MAG: hypothetical protein ACOYLK_06550 [Sphingomonas sp.]|jgi:hypothetical protein
MRRVAFLAITIVGVAAATAPAEAQQAVREACMPDIRAFCANELAAFDRAKVRECLIRNIAKTSPACRAAAKVKRDADRLRSPTPAPK